MTELQTTTSEIAGQTDVYRIISGNIHQDLAVENIGDALLDVEVAVDAQEPDLVCLQEATVLERNEKTSGYLGQVAVAHGMKTNFVQTAQLKRKKGYIHSGLANLVRPEISATTKEVTLSSSRTNRWRPVRQRSLLITTFNDEVRPLHVINTHLSIPLGFNRRTRRKEWKKLLETVDGLEGDVVVSGDFNVSPRSKLIKWCNERLQPISDQTLPTWHNLKKFMSYTLQPRARTIDYIFTNKDFQREITATPLAHGKSDHTWQAITVGRRILTRK